MYYMYLRSLELESCSNLYICFTPAPLHSLYGWRHSKRRCIFGMYDICYIFMQGTSFFATWLYIRTSVVKEDYAITWTWSIGPDISVYYVVAHSLPRDLLMLIVLRTWSSTRPKRDLVGAFVPTWSGSGISLLLLLTMIYYHLHRLLYL